MYRQGKANGSELLVVYEIVEENEEPEPQHSMVCETE
jgi:hypothetical protein